MVKTMVLKGKKATRRPIRVIRLPKSSTKALRYEELAALILDDMERAFRAGHDLALHDAVLYCHETKQPLPNWVMEGLAKRSRQAVSGEKVKKKMGRHASPLEQQRQLLADAYCFEAVSELHDQGLSWVQAFEEATDELEVSAEAIRKAYSRAKKRLNSNDYYLSYQYLRTEPIR
jgi:hypothetical protein